MFIGVFEGTEGREEVRVGATWHGGPGGHGGEGPALDKVRGPGCTLLGPEPWLGRWAE